MIHLYIGDGKGKSCAAAGSVLRLLSAGYNVLYVAFLKDGSSGELRWLAENSSVKLLCQSGLKRFVKDLESEEYQKTVEAQRELLESAVLNKDNYQAVVFDELTDVIELGIIDMKRVKEAIKSLGSDYEIIITGHQPLSALIDLADYYTEFVSHKHPYNKGKKARRGVEF